MFTLQLECPKCGYHTYVGQPGAFSELDELFNDPDNSDFTVCTCHECKTFFNRKIDKAQNNEPIDMCRFCGSENITIHGKDDIIMVCPVCGYHPLEFDSSTIISYF